VASLMPIWHYLPWATGPALAAGLSLARRIVPAHDKQPSKRGLGLVRLITVLTGNDARRRAVLELARLDRDDLTGTESYVDPPPPHDPPPERS
jgi:hypothetical protein